MALRDLLLKISGDGDDAKRELAEVAKDVAAFGEQEAEATIAVNTARAEGAIERATRELREFGRISVDAAAGVEIAKGEAAIARLTARLERLAAQESSPKVDAQTANALIALDRVQARVDKLNASRAEVKVDVDRGTTPIIDAITSAVGGLASAVGSGGGGLTSGTARVSAGFVSFGAVAGPLVAIVLALTVAIGVSLVAALAALAASLAAAVAGIGALAAAIGAVLGPVLVVIIAAVARFAKVLEALKAQSAAAQQAQQQTAAGSAAVTAAAEQQEAAARALADANERLGQASTQAYREMADAAEAASDAVRSVAQAELSRDQAALNTRKAVANLKELRGELGATGSAFEQVFKKFSDVNVDLGGLKSALAAAGGGAIDEDDTLKLEQAIINVRQARLDEKAAIDSVSDAERNRIRTQQRANEFAEKGRLASAGYAAALRSVADANRQVAAAADQQGLAAAQAHAKVLTDRLTDSERKLLEVLQRVGTVLRSTLAPAVEGVFGGLALTLDRAARLVSRLQGAFTTLGRAIGRSLDIFSRELIDPAWISAIREFTAAGGRIATVFTGDILVPFLRIVRDVALQALPFLERGLRRAGDAMRTFSATTGPRQLRDVIGQLIGHLKSWLGLAGQLSRVFLAFVRGGAGEGKKLVDQLTDGARRLADFLSSVQGQNAIREFFAAVIPLAKEFLTTIGLLTLGVLKFVQDTAPTLTKIIGLFNDLVGLLGKINRLGTGSTLLNATPVGPLIGLFNQLKSAATGAGSTVANALAQATSAVKKADDDLADSQRAAAQAQRDLTAARDAARRGLQDLASTAKNAELGRRGAVLDLKDAREQLANDKARGASADELERSRLNVAFAEQRVRDATRDATRAQQDSAKAHRKGVEGDDSVASARQRRIDANRRVAASEKTLADRVVAAEKAKRDARDNQDTPSPLARIKDFAGEAFDSGVDLATSVVGGIRSKAGDVLSSAGNLITGALGRILQFRARFLKTGSDLVADLRSGIASAASSLVSRIGTIMGSVIDRIASFAGRMTSAGRDLGTKVGNGIVAGIRAAIGGLASLGRGIANGLIDAINFATDKINKLLPDKVALKGWPDVNLPDNPIPRIPALAAGGITTGTGGLIAQIGEKTREAVLPLTRNVFTELASAIVTQMRLPQLVTPRVAFAGAAGAAGRGSINVEHQEIVLKVPGNGTPDGRMAGILIGRELARMG